jgi:hypothetical protein
MDTHVKVLGVLFIALSALNLLGALFLILALGGAATIVGAAGEGPDAAMAISIMGLAGTTISLFLVLIAIPGLVTGWGLVTYKPWARILGLVLSVINLLHIPLGTILGVYGFWVLLNKETERLFTDRVATL